MCRVHGDERYEIVDAEKTGHEDENEHEDERECHEDEGRCREGRKEGKKERSVRE